MSFFSFETNIDLGQINQVGDQLKIIAEYLKAIGEKKEASQFWPQAWAAFFGAFAAFFLSLILSYIVSLRGRRRDINDLIIGCYICYGASYTVIKFINQLSPHFSQMNERIHIGKASDPSNINLYSLGAMFVNFDIQEPFKLKDSHSLSLQIIEDFNNLDYAHRLHRIACNLKDLLDLRNKFLEEKIIKRDLNSNYSFEEAKILRHFLYLTCESIKENAQDAMLISHILPAEIMRAYENKNRKWKLLRKYSLVREFLALFIPKLVRTESINDEALKVLEDLEKYKIWKSGKHPFE